MEFTAAVVARPTVSTVTCVATGGLATPATTTVAATTTASAATVGALVFTHTLQHLGAGCLGGGLHDVAAGGLARTTPDGLATHGDGFALFAGLWTKTFDDFYFNVLFREALDVLHEAFFVQAHQIDRSAIGPGAAGAADAVYVVFAHVGNFVVHDVRQVINVNAAGSNVGGYQSAYIAALESRQGLGAGSLALVAMQRHCGNAVLFQELGHIVGAELGAREHQHLAPVLFVNDVRQQGLLFAAAHGVDHLRDALHRGVAWRDLHALRILQQAIGEVADFVAEGGGEQQTLLFFGHQRKHLFYVMDKAHVQHAVGLVEHQHLHLTQVEHALLGQIEQTSRGGHQNIHAFFELGYLRIHAHAAKNDGGGQLQVFAIGANRFFHLRREFTGGGQHQRTDASATEFVLCAAAHGQAVQHGQGECCCFAGTGLGAAQQIMAFHDQGDGLGLDGGRGFIALFTHGFKNGRSQIQFFEVHF